MNRVAPASARRSFWWDPLFSVDGWALFLASTLSRVYLAVLLSLALISVMPVLLGWHGTVVQSGSMEPHISAGDVVIAAPFGADQNVPVGGVVEFTSPASAEPGGVEKSRLHRIVAENTDDSYVTAGDANAGVDSTPLKREQITGQARLLVPAIGLPGLWLGAGTFFPLALWSLLTLLAIAAAVYGLREDKDREEDKDKDGDGDIPASAPPVPPLRARRRKAGAVLGLVSSLAALVITTSGVHSSAAFSATTVNATNAFSTATDWTPPSVVMGNSGSTVRATVALTAEASDAETGIRNVVFQYLPPGGTWTTLCTVTTAPFACSWNTQGIPDGAYSLRAIATDNSGITSTSGVIQTSVANTFSVALTDPGEFQRGTINLTTTLNNPGSTSYSVRVEYSLAGANRWNTLCANLLAPNNCAWNTGALANDYYDLRAVAVSGTTSTYSDTITAVLVDNLAPAVSLTDPGTPLRGISTFAATATDSHAGVAQAQIQYTRTGTSTWQPICTVTTPPYSCRFDTTALANASYSFRATAIDEAGNSTTSTAVTNRIVDNTISSVSMEDPGAYLTGSTALVAAANTTAGVTNLRIQTAPNGTGTWTTRCAVASTPYSCVWDTRVVPDGLYDFRAVLTDGSGKETVSTIVAARRVDNSPLRGADVQTISGAGVSGKLDTGDALSFTYSQQVNLASVTPGWTGAALPVTVRLRDGNVQGVGTGNSGDSLDIQRPGSTVNLGTVNTKGNYAKNRGTITFNATLTATTVTSAGVPRTTVTVTLGTATSGSASLRASTTAVAMVWTPMSSVTSTAGVACSLAPVAESGPIDVDF